MAEDDAADRKVRHGSLSGSPSCCALSRVTCSCGKLATVAAEIAAFVVAVRLLEYAAAVQYGTSRVIEEK